MLNHIVIMGRLVRDPELRRTGSGVAVASFRVAVDRDFAPKDGSERKADFIDCVAWRQTGEFISKYFTKGRMIVVDGRLEMRDWTDKDGTSVLPLKSLWQMPTSVTASATVTAPAPTVPAATPLPATAVIPLPLRLPHPISRCWRTTTLSFLSN